MKQQSTVKHLSPWPGNGLRQTQGQKMKTTGLTVDEEENWFGASLDRLIDS